MKENKVRELCKQINFGEHWVVDAQGHSGGLAQLSKHEGGYRIKKCGTHFIDFEVENE